MRCVSWRALLFLASVPGLCAAHPAAAAEPDRPIRAVEFRRDVVPALTQAGCNKGSCHGSFQGRGGFRLSLLGYDPLADYEALVKESRHRRVSSAAPASSLVLRKPLGIVPHGGGVRFDSSDPAFRVLRAWIEQGLVPPTDDDPSLTSISAGASDVILQPSQEHRIRVEARWSDGEVRDVTEWAQYEVRDESLAHVTAAGLIRAERPGRTHVTVRYLERVCSITVTVPFGDGPQPQSVATGSRIDRLIADEWPKLRLDPAPLADDYEFCRRVHLDLIGALPTPEEVRAFAASDEADKRARLIDRLLERPEYVDYWSSKWGDLLRVHRRYIGERGLWTFRAWVRQAVRENRPIDQLTRELIQAQGNLYTDGPVAFYFIDSEPELLAEATAQVFLGVRLQCARCHHHPYEIWSQDDYYGLANFFTRVAVKDNADNGLFGGARLLRPSDKAAKERRAKVSMAPAIFGRPADLETTDDVRGELADWITAPDNAYFARNWANRYWFYLMGRGLVDPVDDLRATNPPSHPALLDALAEEFVAHGYDAKHLLRLICNSRVYQLASNPSAKRDRDGMFYTHRLVRRLPAAVLLDAINQATETAEAFAGLPAGTRAQQLPDPAVASSFLETFGRSQRASPCECAASEKPDLAQALHLINSESLQRKLGDAKGRLATLLEQQPADDAVIEELYLATLSRPPSSDERGAAKEFLAEAPSRREGFEDLLWALLNSSGFAFNH